MFDPRHEPTPEAAPSGADEQNLGGGFDAHSNGSGGSDTRTGNGLRAIQSMTEAEREALRQTPAYQAAKARSDAIKVLPELENEIERNLLRLQAREAAEQQFRSMKAAAGIVDDGLPRLAGGRLLSRDGLAALPKPRDMIEGVLSAPGACVLVGPWGSYKSFLVLSWGLSVARGKDWMGRKTEQANVLYVVGEGSRGLFDRIRAWEIEHNGGAAVDADSFHVLLAPATLTERSTWEAITEYAKEHGIGFVILDTMSSLAPDADETKDIAVMMRGLSDLATEIDGPALLVHHPGHGDKTRSRGGYQFEANADQVFLMKREDDSRITSLKVKKSKDSEDGERIWMEASTVHDLVGDDLVEVSLTLVPTTAEAAAVPLKDRLVDVLIAAAEGGITPAKAKAALDDPPDRSFADAVAAAKQEGSLIVQGKTRAARYFHQSFVVFMDGDE